MGAHGLLGSLGITFEDGFEDQLVLIARMEQIRALDGDDRGGGDLNLADALFDGGCQLWVLCAGSDSMMEVVIVIEEECS